MPRNPIRARLHEIIFEADTRGRQAFDLALIWRILLSVLAVMLDSVRAIRAEYGQLLTAVEWFFTILFTIEYLLRLSCIGRPLRYATSFFGVVDLLAILPTYLSLSASGQPVPPRHPDPAGAAHLPRAEAGAVSFSEANMMAHALRASSRKIVVFFAAVMTLVVIFGSVMYLIEGEANGFTSIPREHLLGDRHDDDRGLRRHLTDTALGQTIASLVMILGFAIIAVPTGIVVSEISRAERSLVSTEACTECSSEGHASGAKYCKDCGAKL